MQLAKSETNKTPKSPKTNKTPQKTKFVKPLGEEKKNGKLETPDKVIEGNDKFQKRQTPNPSTQGTPQSNEAGLSKKARKRQRRSQTNETPKTPNSENKPQQNDQNKTPDSGKKRKNTPRRSDAANKKQKIDFDKSKPINSNAKETSFKNIKIVFPRSSSSYKETIIKVLESCEAVEFMPSIILKFKPEEAEKKLDEIRKMKIGGKELKATLLTSGFDALKKVIALQHSGVDTDAVKKFFDSQSIEQIISFRGAPTRAYILTFASEKSAAMACQKTYDFHGKKCDLRPYYSRGNANARTEENEKGKQNTKSDEQAQKKGKEQPKKEVEKENVEGDDDDDDDDDDDEEDEELDSEDVADIDMDDDDDEDEVEEDDDDDDDE